LKIQSAHIQNFRAIDDLEVNFEGITTFIGPNGAGKSTILRALEWFFNGDSLKLTIQDLPHGKPGDSEIRVEVVFCGLTPQDRAALGDKYAPDGVDTLRITRRWVGGETKITGRARAFKPFEEVRSASKAQDKRRRIKALADSSPNLGIPVYQNADQVDRDMDAWEREHPELLEEAEVSETHLFGFNGQAKLSGIFDFVLVSADLRASEEAADGRSTIIGRILERAIRKEESSKEFARLAELFKAEQEEINKKHLKKQLDTLSRRLTQELSNFTTGRSVKLDPVISEPKPPSSQVLVSIKDDAVETSVERQGHGFQRALLIASLKLLSETTHGVTPTESDSKHATQTQAQGASESAPNGVLCLAIEEPELFQHPIQARLCATVLRKLSTGPDGIQVAYATHSPYFVEPRFFHEIRRVSRIRNDDLERPLVQIAHASEHGIMARLQGVIADLDQAKRQWQALCANRLTEAFFAEEVLLVEGTTETALLETLAGRVHPLALNDVAVVSLGRDLPLIAHAILTSLGITTKAVFDNDKGFAERARLKGRKETDIQKEVAKHRDRNRIIQRYFKVDSPVDYPEGKIADDLFAIPDTLETTLARDWPEWTSRLDEILQAEPTMVGKNRFTYEEATASCGGTPSGRLKELMSLASFSHATSRINQLVPTPSHEQELLAAPGSPTVDSA
jgi:predicted ATP-dependent endonuclease of OLD family